MRTPFFLSVGLMFLAPVAVQASPTHKKSTFTEDKKAILRVLTKDFNHATKDHSKISPFKVTNLEIRSGWALADVETPRKSNLDPFTTLLHKKAGQWKIVTLGTSLHGSGKEFNVPQALWKRWKLEG